MTYVSPVSRVHWLIPCSQVQVGSQHAHRVLLMLVLLSLGAALGGLDEVRLLQWGTVWSVRAQMGMPGPLLAALRACSHCPVDASGLSCPLAANARSHTGSSKDARHENPRHACAGNAQLRGDHLAGCAQACTHDADSLLCLRLALVFFLGLSAAGA